MWFEYSEALRSITLKTEDLIEPLKVEDFANDHIENQDLVRAYANAVLSKSIIPQRNPLMYEIAMLSIQKACQTTTDSTFKSEIVAKFKDLNLKD